MAKDGNIEKVHKLNDRNLAYNHIADYLEAGYSPNTIGKLRDKASPGDIRHFHRHNVDFDRALEARKMSVPAEDIRYYGKHGNDLETIIKLRENGYRPEFIKRVIWAKNTGKIAGKTSLTAGGFYGMVHNYCNWQNQKDMDDKYKYQNGCENLPTQSMNMTNSTNPAS